jgi:hypothetical protein
MAQYVAAFRMIIDVKTGGGGPGRERLCWGGGE